MAKRTYGGLAVVTDPTGFWMTEDGKHRIIRVRESFYCENPHPFRQRGQDGILRKGYCPGWQEHDREYAWAILGRPAGLPDDTYESLADAVETLANHLKKEA